MRSLRVLSLACLFAVSAVVVRADTPEGFEASFRFAPTTASRGEEFRLPLLVSSSEPLGGLSISVDFDEEVLEATKIELVYQRPDGGAWRSKLIFLDIHRDGRSNINNANDSPGNGGVDEGYLYGAVVFEPEEGIEEYRAAGGTDEELYPPVNEENEILAIHFRVRPDAPIDDTEVRFLDGAPSVNPQVTVENVAALLPGYSADLRTEVGVIGVSALIGIVRERPDPVLFIRGDASGNGATDLSDAIFILEHLFRGGTAPPCRDAADANDDGKIDISDPIALLAFLFVTGTSLPPPGAVPGEDPTSDALDCSSGPR